MWNNGNLIESAHSVSFNEISEKTLWTPQWILCTLFCCRTTQECSSTLYQPSVGGCLHTSPLEAWRALSCRDCKLPEGTELPFTCKTLQISAREWVVSIATCYDWKSMWKCQRSFCNLQIFHLKSVHSVNVEHITITIWSRLIKPCNLWYAHVCQTCYWNAFLNNYWLTNMLLGFLTHACWCSMALSQKRLPHAFKCDFRWTSSLSQVGAKMMVDLLLFHHAVAFLLCNWFRSVNRYHSSCFTWCINLANNLKWNNQHKVHVKYWY